MHKQVQNAQPFRVVYDIQKNRYFRINKLTGQVEPSYKTGKTPAKFDSDITGKNYQARSKLAYLRTIQQLNTEPTSFQHNHHLRKEDSLKRSLKAVNLSTIITDPNYSIFSERGQLGRISPAQKRKEQINIEYNKINQAQQNFTRAKVKTLENESVTLPKLHKRNSETRLEARNASTNNQASPSKLKSFRNSELNADNSFVSSKIRQSPKDCSFVNSMNKLTIATGENSTSQSRMEFEKFENKLRKYSEIEVSKMLQNHFQPLNNDQKSVKLQKFVQKRFLTSLEDESHLTLDQTQNQLTLSRIDESSHERKSITRSCVEKTLDQLSKQKASLLLLSKKCQPRKSLPLNRNQSPIKQQSQPLINAINLLQTEQQQKLKQQLQQEKQTFLSFYPTYVFKDNPRLVKEQKDRKINLKKLELLYLKNNEKKFGRIYRSESRDSAKEKEKNS